jgi:hypothetical protein
VKRYRVIQYGAGNTGKFVLRALLTHPGLQLIGLGVHSAHNEGRDAGDICRLPATGVIATRNIDSLLQLDADCVCYMPTDPYAGDVLATGSHAAELFDSLCRFLASGKNVVATAPNALVYAKSLSAEVLTCLERACAMGQSSFLYVGVSPGFVPDRLVLNLTAASTRIERIVVQEFMNYGAYNNRAMLFDFYGFGRRPSTFDTAPLREALGRSLGGSVAMIADGLAFRLDEIRTTVESAAATDTFEIHAGAIEIGTIAAQRIRAEGIADRQSRISVEHVTRIHDTAAQNWPVFGNAMQEGYRIAIHGAPSLQVDLEIGAFGRNPMADAGWAVAGHVTNSIEALCQAPVGVRSFIDMPAARGARRMTLREFIL